MRKSINFKLIILFFSLFFFSFSTFFGLEVKADNIASDHISERVQFEVYDGHGVYHKNNFSWESLKTQLPDLTEDTYYRVYYDLNAEVGFYNHVEFLDTLTLTFNVEDNAGRSNLNYVLFHLDDAEHVAGYTFPFSSSGCFIFKGNYQTMDTMYSSLSFSVTDADAYGDYITYSFTATINITGLEKLAPTDAEIYQNGYDAGYEDGHYSGLVQGTSSGFNSGYNDGYSAGYEAGADSIDQDSIFDSGFDLGFNSGFNAGKDSVNTDIYFEQGYESGYAEGLLAGSGSVDTDSIYAAGYNNGHNVGYSSGYDDGYARGYAEALDSLETSNSSSLAAGASKTYSFSQKVTANLTAKDANTPFGSHIGESDGTVWHYLETDGYIFDDSDYMHEVGVSSSGDSDFVNYNYLYTYNIGSIKSLFKASPDVYAYKIIIKPTKVSLTMNDVFWIRSMIGTYSDVQACKAEYGHLFINGSTQNSSIWLVTDYADIYVCLGYLSYFLDDLDNDSTYTLDWLFDLEVIPYTKKEFNAAVPAIEKQTLEMQKQTEAMKKEMDDLKNGYDSSVGEQANNKLSDSLDSFSDMEDSMFASATEHLDQFQIFDHNLLFASGAPLSASLTFVTSLMTSTFIQMGGADGAAGIVLSILFTVVLISLALGIYKFYSGKKGGGG